MKKALEAMMSYLNAPKRFEGFVSYSDLRSLIRILDTKIAPEPEKPEPQGSVDWDILYQSISLKLMQMCVNDSQDENGWRKSNIIVEYLRSTQSQWLHPKPAIDPEIKDKYYELLHAVENKFPGETRHQTALRHVKQGETVMKTLKPQVKRDGENDTR